MTDKEMLELAAKAAGVFMNKSDWPFSDPLEEKFFQTTFDQKERSITGFVLWYGSQGDIGGIEEYTWNPLTDDGDALRLAVTCGVHITSSNTDAWASTVGTTAIVPFLDDPCAATRRAITMAAA